ncbi:FumA C-terminus/TtdB family hydratase beta subunit [uncultured Sphaerochaeta sp.]|uniref:FumA C-terminus/TtdB family hydratase beta subunit n=1 Tax=uncultured Sphaerochaeta sp. TaxID=886478 RepID=UPI002A0A11A4|nr:FumA C-terminus/TtdB family hydratase beta subunit [uncultured Sphaerochaeta sp.]
MRKVDLPLSMDTICTFHIFDQLLLSGKLYVARDQAHSRLEALLNAGDELPFPLVGQAIYYMGPSPSPEGFLIGACGPTTSARMDAFTPRLLDLGLKATIGKGPRSKDVLDAIVRNRAVYLQAFGGCGALYASTVKKVETLAFADLGPEALLCLTVEDFPVIVAIDCFGKSVYAC